MKADADTLYRAHGRSLFRYLMRMTGDPDLAADVLHDAFRRLLESPPGHQTNVKGWLFRVATNRLRDAQRDATRRRRLLSERGARLAHSDPPPSPERRVMEREARSLAEVVLQGLGERDRAILLMREEGFTHREIAEAVGTTTKSVGTLIARALDRIVARVRVPERRP